MASLTDIESYVARWSPLIAPGWIFTITILPEDQPTDRASCEASPEYLEANLNFDLSRIPDSDMEAFVVHELLHCVTSRLECVADTLAAKDTVYEEWVRVETETVLTLLERLVLRVASARTTTRDQGPV